MKLLFIIILSFVSVDCFAQNYELDSLQRRKNDLSNRLHQLKDSLREVENEISQIKAKQLVSQFKDSSIEATVRAGAKFKSNPEFQAKVVLTLNKESTVKILNHENNYFYVCSGNICGYVSQQWIVSTTVVEEFKVAKAIERHYKEKKYLVSPFNSTQDFLDRKYYLTNHQDQIKTEILLAVNDDKHHSFCIQGKPGTGKTLLIYDIAKSLYASGINSLLIHCGMLNSAHEFMNREKGWDIVPIKEIEFRNLADYSVVIVDETQRIRLHQLQQITDETRKNRSTCIMSLDQDQCLSDFEVANSVLEKIKAL